MPCSPSVPGTCSGTTPGKPIPGFSGFQNILQPQTAGKKKHTFIFKVPNYMLAQTLTERVVQPGTKPNPDPHPPRGCPSNSLGPVSVNMFSDPLSTTTPAAVGIDNPDCVKWRETLPSQEESAGRDIPMGRLVTKVLVSRESPLPPCQVWPGHNSPVPRR